MSDRPDIEVSVCALCTDTSAVTRVEVIDDNGRAFVAYGYTTVIAVLQDAGRTLKLFCDREKPDCSGEEQTSDFPGAEPIDTITPRETLEMCVRCGLTFGEVEAAWALAEIDRLQGLLLRHGGDATGTELPAKPEGAS